MGKFVCIFYHVKIENKSLKILMLQIKNILRYFILFFGNKNHVYIFDQVVICIFFWIKNFKQDKIRYILCVFFILSLDIIWSTSFFLQVINIKNVVLYFYGFCKIWNKIFKIWEIAERKILNYNCQIILNFSYFFFDKVIINNLHHTNFLSFVSKNSGNISLLIKIIYWTKFDLPEISHLIDWNNNILVIVLLKNKLKYWILSK